MVSTIDYYLSLASPWSYLGHQRLMSIADKYDCQINVHAVDLSIILPATGGIALPKRSQQRKDYRMQELKRWRDYLSLPLNCEPRHFPVIDEVAAAMLLAIREEEPAVVINSKDTLPCRAKTIKASCLVCSLMAFT